jgi:arginine decarboxylase
MVDPLSSPAMPQQTSSTRDTRIAADSAWTAADSAELYQVEAWSDGYFEVRADGRLCVAPPDGGAKIDLYEVIEGLRERGLATPVVLRFQEILADRLQRIHEVFTRAAAENNYRGRYLTVYPIKVNQQRPVVEQVFEQGAAFGSGLEVGSKPELLAVMAVTADDRDARPIICNGFKDSAYIEAVVLATKLGRNIIPVVENLAELRMLIGHAERYEVRPVIGARIKLSHRGAGRWGASVGDRSKFGLFSSELLDMVALLREHDMLDTLQLLHGHPGSQLQDIRRVKEMIGELAHVYAELQGLGAAMGYIDIGGGLGVDYDGSRTNSSSSMNYTLEEYAAEVVHRIGNVCDDRNIEHPTIVSESGRAVAAHHSVLVFDVLGVSARDRFVIQESVNDLDPDAPQPIYDLFEAFASVREDNLIECYHDAVEGRRQATELFALGFLSLQLRGLAERLFWSTSSKIQKLAGRLEELPEELEHLEQMLADTYFCNLSIFQSLPDIWAVGQLFPIMPIHRLDEEPVRRGVLADVTCDSDGRIDRFTDVRDVRRALPLHEPREGEPYYLAALLVGAYQETLGDLHNLFGDAHVVHIQTTAEGGWRIEEIVKGDTASEVLRYVQYDPERMHTQLSRDCELAIEEQRLTVAESRALLGFYESALAGYTYLSEG